MELARCTFARMTYAFKASVKVIYTISCMFVDLFKPSHKQNYINNHIVKKLANQTSTEQLSFGKGGKVPDFTKCPCRGRKFKIKACGPSKLRNFLPKCATYSNGRQQRSEGQISRSAQSSTWIRCKTSPAGLQQALTHKCSQKKTEVLGHIFIDVSH